MKKRLMNVLCFVAFFALGVVVGNITADEQWGRAIATAMAIMFGLAVANKLLSADRFYVLTMVVTYVTVLAPFAGFFLGYEPDVPRTIFYWGTVTLAAMTAICFKKELARPFTDL